MDIGKFIVKKAKQSPCRYRVAAVALNKRGEYLGSATNKPRFVCKGGGLHAEVILMQRYGSKIKSIIICRINKNGDLLKIKPCKNCSSVAAKLGIKIYSLEDI